MYQSLCTQCDSFVVLSKWAQLPNKKFFCSCWKMFLRRLLISHVTLLSEVSHRHLGQEPTSAQTALTGCRRPSLFCAWIEKGHPEQRAALKLHCTLHTALHIQKLEAAAPITHYAVARAEFLPLELNPRLQKYIPRVHYQHILLTIRRHCYCHCQST